MRTNEIPKASIEKNTDEPDPRFDYRPGRKGGIRLCPCGTPVIHGDWSCYSCAA